MPIQAQHTQGHPNTIGNGRPGAMFAKRLNIAAATDADSLNCLKISFNPENIPGGTPAVQPTAGSVQVDGDGAGTQCRITLRVENKNAAGTANSDVSFTIDCDGAQSDWSSGAGVANSLKDIIDLINSDDAGGTSGKFLQGFKCWIGDGGMYDLYVRGASQFQDLAETYVMPPGNTKNYTSFLKRDMAVAGSQASDSDYFAIWRIGMPEARDRGLFKLLDLYGTVTADTGDTMADSAGIMVIRDDVKDYVAPTNVWATDLGNHEVVYWVDRDNLPTGAGAASNSLNHNASEAAAIRGPIVVIVKGDTDFDTNAIHLIAQLQAVC